MYIISKKDRNRIAPLFEGWNETPVWSYLQGHLGQAFVDDPDSPRSAQILIGDFCFFAGIPNPELIENIPDPKIVPVITLIAREETWHPLFETIYRGQYEKFTRYALKKEPTAFDPEQLQANLKALPPDCKIRQIDPLLYNALLKEEWSKDLCSQFENAQDYAKNGLGFVIVKNHEIIAGASSYTYYNDGIEIQIDTKQPYRRQGLARVVGSRLILECLRQNRYPSWDAVSQESLHLAESLGYCLETPYIAYAVGDMEHLSKPR
ncbi:GNAT family N-acetyltransferase [Eubacterium sp. 1001713B170207_170306_E7]|uniref:GNAT family N-acetyltransferase n=1 Tax=Eubacterium sp. 1001713B170207_170306_E7 TaxID=2787097 RepID=UPI00189A6FEF|nr:GNAT family N-acetyltransferase [Eubacterium sp. 1001713B170207_170306_E7]